MQRVLFVCVPDAGHSQIAVAFFNRMRVEALLDEIAAEQRTARQ